MERDWKMKIWTKDRKLSPRSTQYTPLHSFWNPLHSSLSSIFCQTFVKKLPNCLLSSAEFYKESKVKRKREKWKNGPYRKWPGKRFENRKSTWKYYVLRYVEQTLMHHFGCSEKACVEIRGWAVGWAAPEKACIGSTIIGGTTNGVCEIENTSEWGGA